MSTGGINLILDKVDLNPDIHDMTPYRQPSFFDVAKKAEELESPKRIRFLNFPVQLEEIAREGLAEHNMYAKKKGDTLTSHEVHLLRSAEKPVERSKFEEAYQALPEATKAIIDASHRWPAEIVQQVRREVKRELYSRFGSTAGKTYDPSDAIAAEYKRAWHDFGGGGMVHHNSKAAWEFVTGYMQGRHNEFAQRMRTIQEARPWLIEFADRYHDVFGGVTFVGNGYRAIEGSEGTVFFKPEDRYGGTFKISAEIEQEFYHSIQNVVPIGKMRRPRDEVHLDFNGCQPELDAYWLQLKDGRGGTMAYLDRDFGHDFLQGWLIVANPFDAKTVEENRMHPWSRLEMQATAIKAVK